MTMASTEGQRVHAATIHGRFPLRWHWPVVVPLLLFAISACIIPTLSNIATTDDWAYSRAVETLRDDGRLVMYPVVAATAVGQVMWGALFALVFGSSLGVDRLSSVVAVAMGSVAVYAILFQLGVSRARSVLGMALYLFNPLTLVMAFTFMTDPHFVSWLLVSTALTLRGLRDRDCERLRWVIAGAVCAGFAFWIRQQGAFIPVATGCWLLFSGRLRFTWRSVRLVAAVVLPPAIMLVAYYCWLVWFNDVPSVQQGFFDRAVEEGWSGTSYLLSRLPLFAVMYLGLFLLPLALAILPGWRGRNQTWFASTRGYWVFAIALVVLAWILFTVTVNGRLMPYIPQFLGSGGIGAADVPGGRQRLVTWDHAWIAFTTGALVGAVVCGSTIARRIGERRPAGIAGAGLIGWLAAWQLVGVIPPSYQYINRGGSLDRYLLPLVPLAIVLVLWATRDVPLFQPAAWVGIALFGVVAVAGTRDYLTYLGAVWDMAEEANAAGVANEHMDAGSGWDGYYLYLDMLDQGITKSRSPKGSPWWVYFYAKQTDSTYIVTTNPSWRSGYVIVEKRTYSQWLENDTVSVYLMRRADAPWPPKPD